MDVETINCPISVLKCIIQKQESSHPQNQWSKYDYGITIYIGKKKSQFALSY